MGVAVLLDADVEGANVRKKLTETGIARETSVLFVSDFAQEPGRVVELEDLLPPVLYLRFVNELYSRELVKNPITESGLAQRLPIRRTVEEEFSKRGLSFSRFRIAR